MSKPFKIVQLNEKVFSLIFEEKLTLNTSALKTFFEAQFYALEEITTTFNRINLIFKDEVLITSLNEKLSDFTVEDFHRKTTTFYWEIPICLAPHYTEDLQSCFEGQPKNFNNYLKTFLATTFTLEFYGFLPGFGYLSGLPNALHLARKANPNRLTKAGTVAVGGAQVGVYPQDSPGGWQGIGYCPVPWFSPQQTPTVFIQQGDSIRFVEIDIKQSQSIALAVEMGVYQPKKVQL